MIKYFLYIYEKFPVAFFFSEHRLVNTTRVNTSDTVEVKLVNVDMGGDVGTAARIMSRIVIEDRSVITAGTIVTKDIPLHILIASLPAKTLLPSSTTEAKG